MFDRAPIDFPFADIPLEGEAIEVADGILWMRLPLPMALNHVNVYALRDGTGWCIIDTGFATRKSKDIWHSLMKGPLKGDPIKRVIATHLHPDHIGLAGWFQSEFQSRLLTTRTSWLYARMLILDEEERPSKEALAFYKKAGMDAEEYERRSTSRPLNFADAVAPLPVGFERLQQGSTVEINGEIWDVHIGNGHAPEHLTLWSQTRDIVIAGDQILSDISPNIGVYASEPDADPLSEWIESCQRLRPLAREKHLVLPGHKRPFTGLEARLIQLENNHHEALNRLLEYLSEPKTAAECFSILFRKKIGPSDYGLALAESVAHINHLYKNGLIQQRLSDTGVSFWQRV